nr:retrovirus-related Pol polyprotein from transposon TNT 1-94 [Tanacetum cinerariifolium]
MDIESTVPQLVDKKGGMEPYYLKCIKYGPFQPKTTEGAINPESQWTQDERRVVVQDQCPESIIMSCLSDDIMESVMSYEITKATWTDLVHSFEGPSYTKENRIMDLKLKYQTFRAKPTEILSQTYTRYKTWLNELANDGVNLSKHEINVGFINSLPEKWLTFFQGLRNANHTQTLDLEDIYERFVYEDNLIQRRGDLLNALNGVTKTLKATQDVVKEYHVLNKKVIEDIEAYTKNSTYLTELLTLIKNFDFQGLKSLVESLQATALSQDKHLVEWAKSSTSIAWNLGPRMTSIENSQAEIKNEVSFLKKDTSYIKSIMTEIYQAFKDQSSTPSSITEEPPSHTKEETEDMETQDSEKDKVKKEQVSEELKHVVPISSVKPTKTPKVQPITTIISTSQPEPYVPQREGKGIATDDHLESPPKLVKASSAIRPDPDAPILVPYTINGKLLYLTEEQILAHIDKEDQIQKSKEEAKTVAMTKTEVIKIVQKEAKKIGIDPKKVINFGITKLDKLGLIIEKINNSIVKDPMQSLSKRYERLKKIPEELGIQSALPALIPEHAPSQSSRRKRKHMELETEIKVPSLECNRSLREGVPFVNNLVIEEPEYGIFFIDVFRD